MRPALKRAFLVIPVLFASSAILFWVRTDGGESTHPTEPQQIAATETLFFFEIKAKKLGEENHQEWKGFTGCRTVSREEVRESTENGFEYQDILLEHQNGTLNLSYVLRSKGAREEIEPYLSRQKISWYNIPQTNCEPWLRAIRAHQQETIANKSRSHR